MEVSGKAGGENFWIREREKKRRESERGKEMSYINWSLGIRRWNLVQIALSIGAILQNIFRNQFQNHGNNSW